MARPIDATRTLNETSLPEYVSDSSPPAHIPSRNTFHVRLHTRTLIYARANLHRCPELKATPALTSANVYLEGRPRTGLPQGAQALSQLCPVNATSMCGPHSSIHARTHALQKNV